MLSPANKTGDPSSSTSVMDTQESCDNSVNTCPGHHTNKEYIQPEVSLYSNPTFERQSCHGNNPKKRLLKEHDGNSQDSGYGSGCLGDDSEKIRTFPNLGIAPTTNVDFLEYSDLAQSLPNKFNTLVSSPFSSPLNQKEVEPGFDFPIRSLKKLKLFNEETSSSPTYLSKTNDVQFNPYKRAKSVNDKMNAVEMVERALVPISQEANEDSIKFALQKSFAEPNLIGDFSKPYSLPLITGRNQDLKSITPNTLALLMKGEFCDTVTSYKVIDCRYPYEYKGGHINGAINIYTKDELLEQLLNADVLSLENMYNRRGPILIFHCEFSSNRGPSLSRFLRNFDRNYNAHVYPALHYPEIYLLEGGYKNFYEEHIDFCEPKAYVPMIHPKYHDELQYFKKNTDINRSCLNNENTFKRLNFA